MKTVETMMTDWMPQNKVKEIKEGILLFEKRLVIDLDETKEIIYAVLIQNEKVVDFVYRVVNMAFNVEYNFYNLEDAVEQYNRI